MVYRLVLVLVFGFMISGLSPYTSTAAEEDSYFKGKTITYVVGSKPGGGYDRYARLIAPYLEKYLPGSQVVVVNRPAGSGIVALNELFGAAPDGLTIMSMNSGFLLSQIAQLDGIKFDLAELDWIGKAGAESRIVLVHKKSGIDSFTSWHSDGPQKIFVSSGFGSSSYIQTKLLSDVFALNLKVLPGFGGNEAEAALLKGEIEGILTSESNVPSLVATGDITAILRFGEPLIDQFRDVPAAISVAKTEDQKLVAKKISTMNDLGRLTAASPNTPETVLAALRDAYAKALNDQDLLAEAAKQEMPIAFLGGAEVQELVQSFLNQGDNFTDHVKQTLIQD